MDAASGLGVFARWDLSPADFNYFTDDHRLITGFRYDRNRSRLSVASRSRSAGDLPDLGNERDWKYQMPLPTAPDAIHCTDCPSAKTTASINKTVDYDARVITNTSRSDCRI